MYKRIIRPVLFLIDAEKVHHFVFKILRFASMLPGMRFIFERLFNYKNPCLEKKLFGLTFNNPVGLAAGFDKDARLID
jgi:dihydroorotate dehydrogenase